MAVKEGRSKTSFGVLSMYEDYTVKSVASNAVWYIYKLIRGYVPAFRPMSILSKAMVIT